MLKVVHDASASNEAAGGSLLDEIVRDGARKMLAAALEAEVAAYIEGFTDEGRGKVGSEVVDLGCCGQGCRRGGWGGCGLRV